MCGWKQTYHSPKVFRIVKKTCFMNVKHLTFHHFHQSQFLYEKLQLTKGSVGGRSWLQAGNHLSSDSLMQLLTEEPGPQFGRDKLKPAIIFQCQWSCSYEDDRSSESFVQKTEHVAYPLEGGGAGADPCQHRARGTGRQSITALTHRDNHSRSHSHLRYITFKAVS